MSVRWGQFSFSFDSTRVCARRYHPRVPNCTRTMFYRKFGNTICANYCLLNRTARKRRACEWTVIADCVRSRVRIFFFFSEVLALSYHRGAGIFVADVHRLFGRNTNRSNGTVCILADTFPARGTAMIAGQSMCNNILSCMRTGRT